MGADPGALVFKENEFGKPRLAHHPQVHFSLSHSEDQAVLALSDTIEVGVDLERIRTIEHVELARAYFNANESAMIESLPTSAQLLAFFKLWTLKEAVTKAIGKGLSIPFREFEVSIVTSSPKLVTCPDSSSQPDAWDLRLLTPAAGYLCALAAPSGGVELVQHKWT